MHTITTARSWFVIVSKCFDIETFCSTTGCNTDSNIKFTVDLLSTWEPGEACLPDKGVPTQAKEIKGYRITELICKLKHEYSELQWKANVLLMFSSQDNIKAHKCLVLTYPLGGKSVLCYFGISISINDTQFKLLH